MQPIEIDLRNLSEEHLAQCLPHMGKCRYAAPCIIGTLMPPGRRAEFDDPEVMEREFGSFDTTIGLLLSCGAVVMPKDQWDLAEALQNAFDTGDQLLLRKLLAQAQGMALREDPQGAEGEAYQPGDEVMRQTPTKEPMT